LNEVIGMRLMILEDNADRRSAMQAVLEDRMRQFSIEFFPAVPPMIDRLEKTGLYDVALISLDHDLDLIEGPNGTWIDPSTGVEAAIWLSKQPAIAPVIVHTTNSTGGDRMLEQLVQAGWRCHRIVPYGGEDWIEEVWFPLVRRCVVACSPHLGMAACGLQILKRHWQLGYSFDRTISECIRAARWQITGSGDSDSVSIQLFYVDSHDQFTPLIPRDGILSHLQGEFGLGALTVELENTMDAGPRPVRELRVDSQFRDELERIQVREVQIDLVQVPALERMQALMVSASLSERHPLDSHRVQSTLADLKTLVELALMSEMRTPTANPVLRHRKQNH
jgi:hypothetical protein